MSVILFDSFVNSIYCKFLPFPVYRLLTFCFTPHRRSCGIVQSLSLWTLNSISFQEVCSHKLKCNINLSPVLSNDSRVGSRPIWKKSSIVWLNKKKWEITSVWKSDQRDFSQIKLGPFNFVYNCR